MPRRRGNCSTRRSVAQLNNDCLVRLVIRVALHRYCDGLAGVAGGEGQHAGRNRRIVRSRGRRAAAGIGVVHCQHPGSWPDSRVTVKVRSAEPLAPSATLGESIENAGTSSSTIVDVALLTAIDTSDELALLSVTTIVSSGSSMVSPCTGTAIVLLVSVAAKVSVPLVLAV